MSTDRSVGRASQAAKVEHFTVAERAARGKAVRAEVPHSAHAAWEAPPHRPDPVDLLEEQAQARVPELAPIRYGRMLTSAFAFYRGGAYLMASDLAGAPRTGLHVQLCGDAHLSNFGAFEAPDRRLVFSVNDFDETLPGPFEWDVKRLVASFAVACRDRGFSRKESRKACLRVAKAYRNSMRDLAQLRTLDLWYARIDVNDLVAQFATKATKRDRKKFDANVAKARAKDSMRAFSKLTEIVDGRRRIISDPPLIVPIGELTGDAVSAAELHEFLHGVIRSYRRTLSGDRRRLIERFRYVDGARKVVGVGSVGTRAFICLMLGRDDDDPLFLQFKEAQASVLEPYLGKSEFASHGQRVVEGQRLMQSASDIMLGWLKVDGLDGVTRDFYIRQLWDGKGSALVETFEPARMIFYADICGWTLAKAHARSGDPVAIGSYLGGSDAFDHALADFAELYADQNDRDFDAVSAAVSSGRINAAMGF